MKIRIVVASHKPYWMPEDPLYQPVLVGAAGRSGPCPEGWARDDAGENISGRNGTFCELTGLYWAWKNGFAEVTGLAHYRRYLGSGRRGKAPGERLLTGEKIEKLLAGADVILPRKRHYWIETRESQYAHAHHAEDLRAAEAVLREMYPAYLPAWRHMLKTRSGHICNLFIMRRALAEEYCEWLFSILFEVERRLDLSAYSARDRRVFGYLGERLLDVWVETKGLRTAEVPTVTLERENWIRKGWLFLRRKAGWAPRD
ncbi:MAG: DUF4422 domain-containing protein [Clostridia bacterium]|nr:DUF4422 domain-containing protein [Clostridia bacterium]